MNNNGKDVVLEKKLNEKYELISNILKSKCEIEEFSDYTAYDLGKMYIKKDEYFYLKSEYVKISRLFYYEYITKDELELLLPKCQVLPKIPKPEDSNKKTILHYCIFDSEEKILNSELYNKYIEYYLDDI